MLPITLWHDINFTFDAISEMLLGRKALTNPDSVLKSRGITLPTQVCRVKAMVFQESVQMWELDHKEGWVPKNWCFWIVVPEETLESPLNSKISNRSILKEINPEYSWGGLILKQKRQYFGHLMWRPDSLERTLMLGKIEGRRRRGWQRNEMVGWHHWVSGHEFEQTLGDREGQGSLVCLSPRDHKQSDTT